MTVMFGLQQMRRRISRIELIDCLNFVRNVNVRAVTTKLLPLFVKWMSDVFRAANMELIANMNHIKR